MQQSCVLVLALVVAAVVAQAPSNETTVGLGSRCCAHISICTSYPHCDEGLYCATGELMGRPGICRHKILGSAALNSTAAEGEKCCLNNLCHGYEGCQEGLYCRTGEATWMPGHCHRVPTHEEVPPTKSKTGREGDQCCLNNNLCADFEGCQDGLYCRTGEATWMPGRCARSLAPADAAPKANTGAEGEQCCMNNNMCTTFEGCQDGLYCRTGEAT
eukprot:CAMPEP_0177647448 /NCGR_PEP_ID=MMETSP0447-20121125/10304_1 /TAXON_ID=0 /ORGANISM="Stygamoeba regulata, Strain BSH-02190019" /LENGTH=215 /DNA_ID=CAMNT_0019150031 /DNA_START=49 /DNA_END=692 /DNA_ORIENTATION=+